MTDLKSLYPGNAPVSEDDKKKMWNDAFFVFDSNTWLDFYRLSEKRSSELLKIVDKIDKRLYIHVKIIQEFLKHRVDCINTRVQKKRELCEQLAIIKNTVDNVKEEIQFNDDAKHSMIQTIDEKLKTLNEHIVKLKDSGLRDEFTDLFFTKFQSFIYGVVPTKKEDIDLLSAEHKERLSKKLPPGDGDAGKPDPVDAAGDYLIWKQSIEKAKELGKPLILVTSDGTTVDPDKSGWFLKRPNINPVGHPYLIQEFYLKTSYMLTILTPLDFIESANKYIDLEASKELIQELNAAQVISSKSGADINTVLLTKYKHLPIRIAAATPQKSKSEIIEDYRVTYDATWKLGNEMCVDFENDLDAFSKGDILAGIRLSSQVTRFKVLFHNIQWSISQVKSSPLFPHLQDDLTHLENNMALCIGQINLFLVEEKPPPYDSLRRIKYHLHTIMAHYSNLRDI